MAVVQIGSAGGNHDMMVRLPGEIPPRQIRGIFLRGRQQDAKKEQRY
jgi:hypothetical protein